MLYTLISFYTVIVSLRSGSLLANDFPKKIIARTKRTRSVADN